MGDRTTVTLTVLKEHAEEAQLHFDGWEAEYIDNDASHRFQRFTFYEVNYGTLPFLAELMEAGIPFDSDWDHGGDYGPGTHYSRYNDDGGIQEIELSNEYRNPDINELMKLIGDPQALIGKIVSHHMAVTPLPWDNQLENSKLFKTKKLING